MTYVTHGCKELKTKWPIESGLTGGTQKQTGRTMNLMPVDGSIVPKREKKGFE